MGKLAQFVADTPQRQVSKSVHQRKFLACFAVCSSIQVACRWAKVTRNSHYDWMATDPTYPARFAKAQVNAARALEDEAVRRAHQGIRKAVRYKGKIVAFDIEYSDMLMVQLLKANNPDKFTERQKVETTQVVKGIADIPTAVLLDLMPEAERAAFIAEYPEVLNLEPKLITDGKDSE